MSTLTPQRRTLVLATIMLSTFMVAIETTIVATAMPRIVGELGGFKHYSWVFSAYLLAQAATTPIYGKFSDMFGRRPVLVVGILLVLVGSLLCGFAWSMASLIAFRAIQGLGAGAIYPVSMTVIGDIYPPEERGPAQGKLAIVWAVSAVVGPLAGGVIINSYSWAWIFWINIPLALLTMAGYVMFLRENVEQRRVSIDYAGAALFAISITALLLMLTEADGADDMVLAVLAVVFVATGLMFLRQEKRAAEPIISIKLWMQRLIATCNAGTLLAGMGLLGLTTILPIYIQGVLGQSAIVAGFALTTLVVGWPLAVMLSGYLFKRYGIRRIVRIGCFLFPIGALLLLFLTPDSHPATVGIGSFLMGAGMGTISIAGIMLVQESVEWSQRGSATASIIFSRSLGNTLGATVLGAALNIGIAHYGSGALARRLHDLMNEPDGLDKLGSMVEVRQVLFDAVHGCFWAVVVVAVLAVVSSWMIPQVKAVGAASTGAAQELSR